MNNNNAKLVEIPNKQEQLQRLNVGYAFEPEIVMDNYLEQFEDIYARFVMPESEEGTPNGSLSYPDFLQAIYALSTLHFQAIDSLSEDESQIASSEQDVIAIVGRLAALYGNDEQAIYEAVGLCLVALDGTLEEHENDIQELTNPADRFEAWRLCLYEIYEIAYLHIIAMEAAAKAKLSR